MFHQNTGLKGDFRVSRIVLLPRCASSFLPNFKVLFSGDSDLPCCRKLCFLAKLSHKFRKLGSQYSAPNMSCRASSKMTHFDNNFRGSMTSIQIARPSNARLLDKILRQTPNVAGKFNRCLTGQFHHKPGLNTQVECTVVTQFLSYVYTSFVNLIRCNQKSGVPCSGPYNTEKPAAMWYTFWTHKPGSSMLNNLTHPQKA